MRKKKPKERLYHVTRDLGDEVILIPQNPCVPGEPKLKRICCAPTIHQCLLAINFDSMDDLNIYYTDTTQAIEARGVADHAFTGEKWILKDKKFKRLMKISPEFIKNQLKETREGERGIPSPTLYLDKIELEKAFYGM